MKLELCEIMQSDREASIMRVLGTTKKRTRTMLVSEQSVLCLFGIFCAIALLLAINGILLAAHAKPLSAYASLQLASCTTGAMVCAVVITRRRVLELLQVKE